MGKMVHPIASNLFYFVRQMIANSNANGSNKKDTQSMQESMEEFVRKHKIKLPAKGKLSSFKQREKAVVAKTFHGFGLVAPFVDDIGYRPIGYSENALKRILKRMNAQKQKNKKV